MTPAMPENGYLRIRQVLALIPVSKSTWWAGVKAGRYPQPSRHLGVKITAWHVEDIRKFLDASR